MSFGVQDTGFIIKRLPDILTAIEAKEQSDWGPIDADADAALGQLNGTFANQAAEIWEQIQNAYNAASPNLAYGLTLDYNVALNAIARLAALPTVAEVGMKGTDLTEIVQGTQISSTTDGEIFSLRSDITITKLSQSKVYVEVVTVVDSTLYTITINGTDVYTYTSSGSATADEIAQGLADNITADSGAVVTAEKLINGIISIEGKTGSFDITYDSNLDHYSIGIFDSDNKGAILAIANTLTVIETPVSGLDAVNNFIDGVKGRGIELDPELRARRIESLQVIGAATVPAMESRILAEVDNVVAVFGVDNREEVPDGEGRPPHSVEMIVQGGDEQEIFEKLWRVKAAGIKTHGNTPGTIIDSSGNPQALNFSRPVNKYAHMTCDLVLYSEEEFPTDGITQVENQILLFGESLGIGKDIIPDRFKGPIYEIPGILGITLLVDVTNLPGDSPSYGSAPIPIAADEISVWDTSRIFVSIP